MKINGKKEQELNAELETAYQNIFNIESQLKKYGNKNRHGTTPFRTIDDFRNSEERYRRLFETAQDGILILDGETGAIIDANPYITNSLGYSFEELLGKRLWEIGAFVDVKDSKAAFEELQKNEYIRYKHLPLKTKEGQDREVEFISNVYLVNSKKIIQCNIRDITERRTAEQAILKAGDTLRESEERYRRLFETAQDGILLLNAETGAITDANPFIIKLLGYTLNELAGKRLWEIGAFADVKDSKAAFEELQQKEYIRYEDLPLTTKEGKKREVEFVSNVYLVSGKKVIQCNIRDITDRKLAEESLRLLNSAVLQSKESILITDAQLELPGPKIVFVNPAFTKMTGYSADEVIGKTPRILQGPKTNRIVLDRLKKNLENGEVFQGEAVNYRKDGTPFILEWQIAPIQNSTGITTHFVALQRDITERKQADELLSKSEEKFRNLVETLPDGFYRSTAEGRFIDVNKAMVTMLGYDNKEELLQIDIPTELYFQHDDRIPSFDDQVNNIETEIYRLRKKDGTGVWIEDRCRYIRDESGNIKFHEGVARDITERKQTEAILKESEEKFRIITENSADAIFIADTQGKYVYVNNKAANMLGYSIDELLSFTIVDISPKNRLEEYFQILHHILQEGKLFIEIELVTKDGSIVPTDFNAIVLPNGNIYVSCRDITDRKRTEKLIRESEKRFKALFDQAPIAIALVGLDGHPIILNESLTQMLGYSKVELQQMMFTDFTYHEDVERDLNKFNDLIEGKISQYSMEKRFVHKKGNLIWVNLLVTIIQDENGAEQEIIAMAEDISERKLAEIALQESNNKFHQLADNITDAFWIRSPDLSVVQYVSKAFEKIWGRSVESLYANPQQWSEFIHPEDRERVLAKFATLTGNVRTIDLEYRITRPDEEIRWVHVRGFQVRNDDDTIMRHIGIVTDITEKKQTAEAHEIIYNQLTNLYNSLPEAIFSVDVVQNKMLQVSPAHKTIFGHTQAEFFQNPNLWYEMIIPEDKPIADTFLPLLGKGNNIKNQYRILRPDGEIRWIEASIKPTLDSDGKLIRIDGMTSDITARKQIETELRESEEMFRKLFDESADPILLLDEESKFTNINPSTISLLGYNSKEEILNKKPWDLSPERQPDGLLSAEKAPKMISQAIVDGYNRFEWIHTKADGSDILVEVLLTPITLKGKQFLYTVWRDISERKKSEERILLLAHTLESVLECVSVTDMKDNILFVNKAFLKTYGYSNEDLLGKNINIVRSPNNPPKTVNSILSATLTGGWSGEILNRRKNGEEFPISLSTSFVHDENGNTTALVGVATDITEQKKEAAHLQESEERYRRLVEYSPTAIMVHSFGKIVFVNPAAVKLLAAQDMSELIGKPILEILHKDHKASSLPSHLLGDDENEALSITKEKFLRLDDVSIDVEVVSLKIEYNGKPAMQDVIRDVTEQQKLQQQLLQVQKNESIGTLAGGIAHDFNNILAIIVGYVYIIEKRSSDAKTVNDSVAAINQAVKRGAALVKQILTFARKGETVSEPISIVDLIHELISMLKQTFPKTITFHNNISPNIPFIFADRTQIHQALLNLLVNARDAMPNGGSIKFNVEKISGVLVKEQFSSADQIGYICISVSDTGEGMSEATRNKIFDPFFTTKPLGKGTGLGLSVVYGVVQSNQGFIAVESELGKGTTFRLYFPVPSDAVKSVELSDVVSFDNGGSETILLVEDEVLLMDMVRFLLESKGYTVFVAYNGAEAVEMYNQHQKEIDLVVTDLGLPVMSGLEEYKKLKLINPNINVIFASGFIDPDVRSELLIAGAKHFLQKPYVADDMLMIIREALS